MHHHVGLHFAEEAFGVVGHVDAERFLAQDLAEVLPYHLFGDVDRSDDLHVGFGEDQLRRGQADGAEAIMNHPDFFGFHWRTPLVKYHLQLRQWSAENVNFLPSVQSA